MTGESRVVKGLVEALRKYKENVKTASDIVKLSKLSGDERCELDRIMKALENKGRLKDFFIANNDPCITELSDLVQNYDLIRRYGEKRLILDETYALDSSKKSYIGGRNYWNMITDGRKMAQMLDYYFSLKQIKHDSDFGTEDEKHSALVLSRSLYYELKKHIEVTDTTIIFDSEDPSYAKISNGQYVMMQGEKILVPF